MTASMSNNTPTRDTSLETANSTAALSQTVGGMSLAHPPPPTSAPAAAATPSSPAPTTTSAPNSIATTTITSRRSSTSTVSGSAHQDSTPTSITWEQVQAIHQQQGLHARGTVIVYLQYTQHLQAAGQLDPSIEVLQRVLKEAMTTLGGGHEHTVWLCDMLAFQLLCAGKYKAALLHLRWLVSRVPAVYPDAPQPLTLNKAMVLTSLSRCLTELGQHTEAVTLAEEAHSLAVQHYGGSSRIITSALCQFLRACAAPGSHPAGAVACERAHAYLADCRRRLRALDEPGLGMGQALFAYYTNTGQHKAAFKVIPELVAAAKQLFGETHLEYLSLLKLRATNAIHCGRHAQAISMLQNLLRMYKSQLGEGHPDSIRIAALLGTAYSHSHRPADAAKIFEAVWPVVKRHLRPDDHLSVAVYIHYTGALGATRRHHATSVVHADGAAWGITKQMVLEWLQGCTVIDS